MYSLDVKRLQEKKQRNAAWINKKLAVDSPQAKESRIQRIYGKSASVRLRNCKNDSRFCRDGIYDEYNHRVSNWATATVDEAPEWKDSYGHLITTVANPM